MSHNTWAGDPSNEIHDTRKPRQMDMSRVNLNVKRTDIAIVSDYWQQEMKLAGLNTLEGCISDFKARSEATPFHQKRKPKHENA